MLAAIDKLPDVDESRVNDTGLKLLVRGGDPEAIVASLHDHGYAGTPTGVSSTGPDDAWMSAADTIKLSRREAKSLAAKYAAAIAEKHKLDAAWLEGVLNEELDAWFDKLHATGARPGEAWNDLVEAVGKRLPADKRDAVIEDFRKLR